LGCFLSPKVYRRPLNSKCVNRETQITAQLRSPAGPAGYPSPFLFPPSLYGLRVPLISQGTIPLSPPRDRACSMHRTETGGASPCSASRPARQMRAAWPWARTPMISAVYRTRPTLACPYKIGLTLFLLFAVAAMGRIPHTSVAALCSPQPLASRTAPPQWKKVELIPRAPKPRCAKGTDATLDRELHPFCAL
jgi:hypothetical protein